MSDSRNSRRGAKRHAWQGHIKSHAKRLEAKRARRREVQAIKNGRPDDAPVKQYERWDRRNWD